MKLLANGSMVFFTGLVAASLCLAETKPAGVWHSDYQKGRRIAKEIGKPIFLIFR